MRVAAFALLGALAIAACGQASSAEAPPARRAFYYWRTTFALSPAERRALDELHVARLYVRAFDLTWSEVEGGATIVGPLTAPTGERAPDGVEIVPVIFVRDEVFRKLPADRIAALAHEAWTEAKRRAQAIAPDAAAPRELQLDCDWTEKSERGYFAWLRALRSEAGVPLSTTIRLHQVKYRERTGVPPVERGMLMFYNMGAFSPEPEMRAIFDAASAERYLARIHDYPLSLDVALPIWSWTLHVRDDRVIDLLQSTDPGELAGLDFLRATSTGYMATRNAFLHGVLLREGDVLKPEFTGPAETMAAARLVAPHLAPSSSRTTVLFDLSERNVERHGTEQLARELDLVR